MLQILQGGGGGGGIDMEGLVREVLLGPILTLILFKTNIFQSYVRHNALFFDPVFWDSHGIRHCSCNLLDQKFFFWVLTFANIYFDTF